MNEQDAEILAELLIRWEELYEQGHDHPAIELAADMPHLVEELQQRIQGLKATSWLNRPIEPGQPGRGPEKSMQSLVLSGRYRLDELLAEGGFAQVWRAYDIELHRNVAVKMPKVSRIDSTEAFMAEARRVARLKHPGIVTVHDVGVDNGKCFIVSEFVEAGSLADYLARQPVSIEQSIRWIGEIADALQYAHASGVIHRDIKPPNILIDHHGRALLADFGIAQSASKTGRFAPSIGTLRYMSPEQLRGEEATTRSDIYSLGVVLFELVTKRSPYVSDEPVQLRSIIMSGEKAGLELLPAELKRICTKAMEKEPVKRYEAASDLADELRMKAAGNAGTADLQVKDNHKAGGFIKSALILTGLLSILIMTVFFTKNGKVKNFQTRTRVGEVLKIQENMDKVFSVDISPDGKTIATGDIRHGLKLWDAETGKKLNELEGHTNWVRAVAFSNDGKWLATGSGGFIESDGKPAVGKDNSVRLWDAHNGNAIRIFEKNKEPILAVAFSKDDQEVISAGDDDNVKLWQRDSGKLIQNMLGHWDDVHCVIFIPERQFAVSGSEDGGIRLWDLDRGTELRSFSGHEGSVESVACTSDRKYLVSGGKDATIRIWDFNSGNKVREFKGHVGEVNCIKITPDNGYIIAGGSDGIIRIFDFSTDTQYAVLEGHDKAVLGLAVSVDGKRLVSGGMDGTARLWNLPVLPVNPKENHKEELKEIASMTTTEDCDERARRFMGDNQFDLAALCFSRAIEMKPQAASLYLNRAICYFKMSDYQKGLADYQKTIEIDPKNAKIYQEKAMALSSISRFDEAFVDVKQAILIDQANQPEYERTLAKIYAARAVKLSNGKNHGQAAEDMTTALRLDPNGKDFYHIRGKFYFNNKEYEKAAADFTRAIEIEPKRSEFYLHRAWTMHYLNRMEDKEADFRKVKELEYKP